MILTLNGLWLLLALLGPFILLQRGLHKELQSVFFVITRRVDVSIVLFSILFLPGVVLHEISHYLTAILLRVRTGRFSIIPQNLGNGRFQLGYVETEKTDIFRDSIIGIAPLISGGVVVGFIGKNQLNVTSLWETLTTLDFNLFLLAIQKILNQSDFWIWFYFITVISSTMLPSKSDRRAWLPLTLLIGLLILVVVLTGFGPPVLEVIGNPLNEFLTTTGVVFAISSVIHLIVLIPVYIIKKILFRFTGLQLRTSN